MLVYYSIQFTEKGSLCCYFDKLCFFVYTKKISVIRQKTYMNNQNIGMLPINTYLLASVPSVHSRCLLIPAEPAPNRYQCFQGLQMM